jgi:hypothetical protein
MKNHLRFLPLLCLLFFSLTSTLRANELYPVSLTQRVNNSTLIAEGKVISQYSFQETPKGNIYTSNIIQVYRTFKGDLKGEQIEIITEGGTVGMLKQVHSSTLSLSIGEVGVFFCMPPAAGISGRSTMKGNTFMVYSSLQGFIVYDKNNYTAADPFTSYNDITAATRAVKQLTGVEKRVSTSEALPQPTVKETTTMGTLATPTISSISPLSIPSGTDAVLTITGTNFGAAQGTGFVEFRNANSSNPAVLVKPLLSDYVSWTDTEIKVKVPSVTLTAGAGAGSGTVRVTNSDPATVISVDVLTIPYAYSNVPDVIGAVATSEIPTHINLNGAGGYTFQMETSFAANTPAKDAFIRAMHTWECNTRMNWTIGAVTAVNTVASDNVNVVRFDVGSELPAGVLGRCTSWLGGCGANPSIWVVGELDVVFDDARPWQFGPANATAGQVDFESVAVHELGHGQQLNHIISPGAVMHFSIAAGTTSRVLGAGDITGGNVVTARGFLNFGCAPPMTPGNPTALGKPAGTAGGAAVCATLVVAGGGTDYADANCNVIARIVPSGGSPVSGSINVCTKYESGVPSFNSQAYLERHYDIVPAVNPATATATVTLYYTQAEFTAFNAANGASADLPIGPGDAAGIANLRITQYHGTSGTGLPGSYSGSPQLIDPADANIIWNANASRWEVSFTVNGFSGFFVHTGSAVLPLRLLQFSASPKGGGNLLQWTTVMEQETAFFEVQRSVDGVNFTSIGQVSATGSTTGNYHYTYTDEVGSHSQPVYYYRLRMVDNNTQFTYSNIVRLKRTNQEFQVKVLQNPFRQQLQVDINSPQVQECVITLTDLSGRMVAQRTVVLPNGNSIIDIPGVQKTGAGTYVLSLATTTEKRVIKVMKQH